jgi:hypothetical protein
VTCDDVERDAAEYIDGFYNLEGGALITTISVLLIFRTPAYVKEIAA